MHDYSIDNHPKEKILFGLAFIAITAAPILNDAVRAGLAAVEALSGIPAPPVTAIPVFGFFIGLYQLFNQKLWKIGWVRKFLLVPDLNGEWVCKGETMLKNGAKADFQWEGKIVVTQSWSKIRVHLQTKKSSSKSVSASIFHDKGVGYRLQYLYESDPTAAALDLNKHDGFAEILFSEDCLSGKGNYFTDQHRQTVGILSVTRS
ncbi:hypothetical protein [Halomonas sp. JS92-SW72]|uniref:Cap15 family cyclic dinucleotide receptor domain-containing protein n=1 Tax=Halomonas sp. JS92-SW72 TaxID=2306583 RepID=UPI0013C36339|nr:hypothetical protein [Halomonas sp. JS92-SW72]